MLGYGQVKQETKLGVVLLLKHDSLLKGAAVLHDVHCHGVNDVADALIGREMDLDIRICSKSAQTPLYKHGESEFAAISTREHF